MARPRKSEAELRSRTIGVRVNTVEIAERAGAARMTTGGYMRQKAFGSFGLRPAPSLASRRSTPTSRGFVERINGWMSCPVPFRHAGEAV